LKDILTLKDQELYDLKKTLKSTKIKELEIETKAIMTECLRLRGITENAIKLSGELDVERM
jgi:D-serine dehydratase